MKNKNKQIIIVPDVHGRSFWKCLMDLDVSNYDIIFLGDYLDPYPWENISNKDSLENFENVINFAKEHKENVTLLLGNHDLEYINKHFPACRCDYLNLVKIREIFETNWDLFNIGTYREINENNFSFTHSCILKGWVDDNIELKDLKSPNEIIDFFNKNLHNDFDNIIMSLSMISRVRGGYDDFGSLIWADESEISNVDAEFEGWFQVFGHSQQLTKEMIEEIYKNKSTEKLAEPIITKYYACVDCKQLFTINDNWEIIKYK